MEHTSTLNKPSGTVRRMRKLKTDKKLAPVESGNARDTIKRLSWITISWRMIREMTRDAIWWLVENTKVKIR
jgi:hypothetical protein